jgi:catechol 2,3-dioxygenase-like lactoylglutathione lyase family enzyme
MPHFKKLTPNLLVANVERSLAFYTGTLGFERGMTVPDESPFVFASVTSGPIEIFFNDATAAVKEYPDGMREFAIEDPDGYVITFAERT